MKNDPLGFYANDPLGFNEKDPLGFGKEDTDSKLSKGALGMGEALLSMATKGLAQIPAGISGVVNGLANWDSNAGMDAYNQVSDAYSYEPSTESGKQQLQKWGTGLEHGIQKLSDIASAPMLKGSELAHKAGLTSEEEYLRQQNLLQTGGRAGTELGLNFLPLPVGKGAGSAAKGLIKRVHPEVKPSVALDAPVTPEPVVNQLDMFPDHEGPGMNLSRQQIAEMQARETGQADMFAPQNEPLPHNVGAVSPDAPRIPTMQDELPLHMTPEQIAAQQVDPRQADMFAGNKLPDVVEPPVGRMPTHQDALPDFTTPEEISLRQADPAQPDMFHQQSPDPYAQAIEQRNLLDQQATQKDLDLQNYDHAQAMEKNRQIDEMYTRRAEEQKLDDLQKEVERLTTQVEQPLREGRSVPRSQMGAVHSDLLGLGVTDKMVDLFRKFVLASDKIGSDPYMASRGDKAVASRARNALFAEMQSAGINPNVAFNKMHQIKDAEGLAALGTTIPKGQRGAVDYDAITGAKSSDPLIMGARAALAHAEQKAHASKIAGLSPYLNDIDSPAKVIAKAYDNPKLDITPAQLKRGRTVTPGVNVVALASNNPLIKFLRKRFTDVHFEADNLSRVNLTDPKTGIIPLYHMTKAQDRVDAHAIIMKGDHEQHYYTRPEMQAMGASEQAIKLVEKYYETDKTKLNDVWNVERKKSGMELVKQRDGHAPGSFFGDYKKPVFGVTKNGEKEVVGVLTGNSERQIRKYEQIIKDKYQFDKNKYTHLDFSSKMDRRRLGGNGNRTDLFSGQSDVLNVLARNNESFETIKELLRSAIRENADAMYGANKHALEKKGVFGSEGNKPWRDAKQNADDFFRGYFRYWEEGVLAHKYVPLADEMGALFNNPALDNWPNAKQYAQDYINNATGQSVGSIGNAFNAIIDAPFEAIGQGSSRPRNIINQLNKRSGQLTMAFGNIAFSLAQYLQFIQTAIPEMVNVAKAAGVSGASPALGIAKTLAFTRQLRKAAKGKENSLSPFMQEALDEAHRRGLDKFSEFQDVNQAVQHPISQSFDKIVDAPRSIPERQTRSAAFYSIANMLEGKLPNKDIWDVAYNATQSGLFDYNLHERPMMYQKMGTTGQLAGSLQTFKHNYISQQARLIEQAKKGNVGPMMASLASMFALTGLTGIPFYSELDDLVKLLTNEVGGVQKNIARLWAENSPKWTQEGWIGMAGRGAATNLSGLNVQSRLSAANTLPDSFAEAVSPYASLWGDVLKNANQVRKTPTDSQAWKNLGISMTPVSIKPYLEEKYKSTTVKQDGVDMLTPKDSRDLPGNPRSQDDWAWKRWGLTTLDQAKLSEDQRVNLQKDRRDKDAQAGIIDQLNFQYGRLSKNEIEELGRKYVARGGDPKIFVQRVQEIAMDKMLPKQNRLQGTPTDSISSINKYQNLNGNY